jgi:hypothetical protein
MKDLVLMKKKQKTNKQTNKKKHLFKVKDIKPV